MSLALAEMRRRPGRFAFAVGALTLLVVLLLLLGGLLDGLYRGSTGALRAQDADLLVLAARSRDSLLRSVVTPAERRRVTRVPGVRAVRGLGVALVGVAVPGRPEPADGAVIGYEGGVRGVPLPPGPNEAWVDRRLAAQGVRVGQRLLLGRGRVPVRVRGFVSDTSYLLQGGIWVRPGTWRRVLAGNRPDAALGPREVQGLAVRTEPGVEDVAVAAGIRRATAGRLRALSVADAVAALPGVQAQNATFTGIIAVTFVVAGLVVGLFFALVTLERTPLYGVLKALGASSGQLVTGVCTQAVVTAGVAYGLGSLAALALVGVAPASIPVELRPGRAGVILGGLLLASLAGSLVSLRRLLRIDPAAVIGGA